MQNIIDENGSQRIDKWLNISCLFKTRAKAAKACVERRIKINGEVAKPAKTIEKGDRITIKSRGGKFSNLIVLGIAHKNISSKEAQKLYEKEEFELSEEAKELVRLYKDSNKRQKRKYKGRPTKKERRKLEKIKEKYRYF